MQHELTLHKIEQNIYTIRAQRVILDVDLAAFYEIPIKRLNEQVCRHDARFPDDFRFQLNKNEYDSINTQAQTIGIGRGKHRKFLPYAFTEQGIGMLSGILNTPHAIAINIAIMRALAQVKQQQESKIDVVGEMKNLGTQVLGYLENIAQSLNTLTQKVDVLSTQSEFQITTEQPAQKLLTNSIRTQPISRSHNSTADRIQSHVAEYFCLTVRELKQTSRRPSIAHPRQIAMYLIRKQTRLGFKEIGKNFGNRNHTTVLHACQQIEAKLKHDAQLQQTITEIQRHL